MSTSRLNCCLPQSLELFQNTLPLTHSNLLFSVTTTTTTTMRVAGGTTLLPLFLLLLLSITTTTTTAHNITTLLSKHPEFSTFSHYLTLTHLATDINTRTTITVLAVSNPAMSKLLSTHPSLSTLRNILSLHILLDYFGAKKIHQITNGTALAATLYQATGSAPGSSGFVNITDLKGGKVGLSPVDANNVDGGGGKLDTFFVKSVEEVPYNISVIQISGVLPSDVAMAPSPGPSELNLTEKMAGHGCKVFADTLAANAEAMRAYEDTIEGGLTIFCPLDDPFKAFLPKYKNLTAEQKVNFLEFAAVPVFHTKAMLKSNNGLMNTLATNGASKYDFMVQNDGEEVTLKTKVNTVKVTDTLLDEEPVAIYSTDKVLMPSELFKAPAPTPAPAPAPEVAADTPKPSKVKSTPDPSDSPADSPEGDVADQTADDSNDSVIFGNGKLGIIILNLCIGFLMV